MIFLRLGVPGRNKQSASVVGKWTSTIWVAVILSIMARLVSPEWQELGPVLSQRKARQGK